VADEGRGDRMNTVQRIAKNTGVLLASQVVSYVIGFFFVMYTARYLGAEGFGVLSFALAFTGIFGVFADLGLSTLAVREVARDKSLAGKYLGNIAVMKVILVIVTFGLIALFINLLGYPEQTIKVVYLVALSIIFGAFSGMFYSIFRAYEKMEYQSVGQILSSALMLSGALFAISQGLSVIGFASIYFLVSAIVLGYAFAVYAWKFSLPKMEVDLGFWKPTIKEALPFFLSAVFSVIAFRIDIVMLSMMKGDIVVGWYSAAYRLMEVLMFIPATFVGSIYPVLSNFYVSSQESLKIAYQKSFKYLSIVGLPIAVGTTLLADKIILIIYKSGFVHSIIALQVLIWTIPIIFLTYMFGTMLASIDRQTLTLKILLFCMSLNVVINLILIPRYSYVGASIATVITELLAFILCYYFLSKFIYKIPIYKFIAKPIMASAIMGLFILSFVKMNFFLLVCISIVVYLGMLILLRTFSKEDLNLFKQIVSTKEGGVKE
jgi:O-antigen/teichoic acid export membrane protein